MADKMLAITHGSCIMSCTALYNEDLYFPFSSGSMMWELSKLQDLTTCCGSIAAAVVAAIFPALFASVCSFGIIMWEQSKLN
jgi:hypothetical protein